MSYILYINGNLIELSEASPIAQTKQVNDIARLDNRQTNFTNKFTVKPTANNVRAMDKLYLTGNQSNIPYQKNTADLFDAVTGVCMIYKGRANITGSSDKGYEIHVYDGNIDIYKAIENLSLSDVGISDLNHIKNLDNVINSFSGVLNYMYIIADYNGNNKTANNALNIDYQLPSARISYLWDRIFQFIGMTYTGSVFESDKFLNHWMTYPKPVPTLEPIITPISSQESQLKTIWNSDLTFSYNLSCLPNNFDTANADNNANPEIILIKNDGSYRLKVEGVFYIDSNPSGLISWFLVNSIGEIKSNGTVNGAINESFVIAANSGDKLYLGNVAFLNATFSGSIQTTLDYILGYDANFDEALINFKVKDFINEIMQDFGLTMFKDKYSNNVDFRTLKEILQGNEIVDWSSKFPEKGAEKYTCSNYAKKNNFKYRYNDDNVNYNDGFISVNNENLNDEVTIIASKIYSPEKLKSYVEGLIVNVYKFWSKEIKDDSTVEYKELTGRYYFLRAEAHTFSEPILIGSQSLNTETTVSVIKKENYSRLKYQEIIYDNYAEMESILDKSKTIEVNFNLKTTDVEAFTFKNLIYVEQFASYYLVNKIINFIKGKKTKCEIIEVDYLKTLESPIPEPGTYISITNITTTDCDVVIDFNTDFILPKEINVIGFPNSFGVIPPPVLDPQYYYNAVVNAATNQITITVLTGGYWQFYLRIPSVDINSNIWSFENTATCSYVPPGPELTYITITNVQTLSIVGNVRTVRIDYTTDLQVPNNIDLGATSPYGYNSNSFNITTQTGYVVQELGHKAFDDTPVVHAITLSHSSVNSNTVNSNS